jgi:serine protease Do
MNNSRRTFSVSSKLMIFALLAASPSIARADDANDEAMRHARSLSFAFRRAAEHVMPAVVTVTALHKVSNSRRQQLQDLMRDPRFREFFPDRLPFEIPDESEDEDEQDDVFPEENFSRNVGSGVVIDSAGIVLTNNHVVENAEKVLIRLADGSEAVATEILADPKSDLAIVKIKADSPLPAASLGDSAGMSIGDWVIAIGSPFELEATVSAGIISAKGRSISRIERSRLLQTDAAINPGNSGGPLVSLEGKVVGINTAIATLTGGYQGVGFAIPVNQAKWISQELLEHGKVRRAYLGIRIAELNAEAAAKLELRARSGVLVVNVLSGSPADTAEMEANDVIVDFAGIAVRAPGDLQSAVEQKPIGSDQSVTVVRSGEEVVLQVKVTALE